MLWKRVHKAHESLADFIQLLVIFWSRHAVTFLIGASRGFAPRPPPLAALSC